MIRQAIIKYDLDMAMHRIAIDESLASAELADLMPEQHKLMFEGDSYGKDTKPHGNSDHANAAAN
jgi:hypothetical protein